MDSLHKVKLSKSELGYLKSAKFLKPDLFQNIENANCNGEKSCVINLDIDTIEAFRDCFTEELAQVGFDENYEPNEEGKILENLIDRFYIA